MVHLIAFLYNNVHCNHTQLMELWSELSINRTIYEPLQLTLHDTRVIIVIDFLSAIIVLISVIDFLKCSNCN